MVPNPLWDCKKALGSGRKVVYNPKHNSDRFRKAVKKKEKVEFRKWGKKKVCMSRNLIQKASFLTGKHRDTEQVETTQKNTQVDGYQSSHIKKPRCQSGTCYISNGTMVKRGCSILQNGWNRLSGWLREINKELSTLRCQSRLFCCSILFVSSAGSYLVEIWEASETCLLTHEGIVPIVSAD